MRSIVNLPMLALALLAAVWLCNLSMGQQSTAPPAGPTPYGAPINLAQARKIMAAAEAEANSNNWPVVIAIMDSGGHLVMLQRLDNTQLGSIDVALGKAKTAVLFRRSTKDFEDRIAMGGAEVKLLRLDNATPLQGGLPIVHEGRIIGSIGVSGVRSDQDEQVAAAGIKALAGN